MIIRRIRPKYRTSDLMRAIEYEMHCLRYNCNVAAINSTSIKFSTVRLSSEYIREKGYNYNLHSGRQGRCLNWNNWLEVDDCLNRLRDSLGVSFNVISQEIWSSETDYPWISEADFVARRLEEGK